MYCVCVLLFSSSDSRVCNHGDDHLRGWSCKPPEWGSSQWTTGVDPSTRKQASANQREEDQWVTSHTEILNEVETKMDQQASIIVIFLTRAGKDTAAELYEKLGYFGV